MNENTYKVILYYHFAPVDDLPHFCADHRRHCQSLGLKGRIYIASEGINGTVAGETSAVEAYQAYLCSLKGFEDIEFKEDTCGFIPFVKLIVKTRPEIVSLKAPVALDPRTEGGRHLSPAQWRAVLENEKDILVIDVRNDYESAVGHFKGAVCPPVKNFYDFPQWLDGLNVDKTRKVLMYCTGGIRCEKFSVLMKKKGFRDVNQLHGGIINYAQMEGGAHFVGKCFVFDDRLTVPMKPDDEPPLTCCEITGQPWDQYVNCANFECNRLFICSPEGAARFEGCCSEACMASEKRRPFDPDQIYTPTRKWHRYYGDQPKPRSHFKTS